MKAYLIRIVATALAVVFADVFLPRQWRKYTGVVTGLCLLLVLIQPAAEVWRLDFFRAYPTEEFRAEGEALRNEIFREEFSKRISTDVRERISEEFSEDVSVETELLTDETGALEKILSIRIYGVPGEEAIRERIAYVYDAEEVILVGE